jgi:O-antigen/teichoic acid export membrane protein
MLRGSVSISGRMLARARADSLLRNSSLIMATTIANSLVGYVYWIVAARTYAPRELGFATALIAAMTLTSLVSSVGTGHTLVSALPRRRTDREWSLTFNTAQVLGASTGLLAAVIVALGLPAVSHRFEPLRTRPAYFVVFVAGVALWTASLTFDFAYVAERRAGLGLARNATFGVAKLGLLLVPVLVGGAGALGIFSSWVGGSLVGVGAGLLLLLRARHWSPVLAGARSEARRLRSLFVGHHLTNVGAQLPMLLLPVLVTIRLSTADNAYFYVTWMLAGVFFLVSPAVAHSLFAEGAHDPGNVARKARSAVKIISGLLAGPMLVCLLAGGLVLSAFGPKYPAHSLVLLHLLIVSAIPDAITNIYVSVTRVREQLVRSATLNVGMGLVAIVLAWFLLPGQGIAGVGWAWLIAQSAGCAFVVLDRLASRARAR